MMQDCSDEKNKISDFFKSLEKSAIDIQEKVTPSTQTNSFVLGGISKDVFNANILKNLLDDPSALVSLKKTDKTLNQMIPQNKVEEAYLSAVGSQVCKKLNPHLVKFMMNIVGCANTSAGNSRMFATLNAAVDDLDHNSKKLNGSYGKDLYRYVARLFNKAILRAIQNQNMDQLKFLLDYLNRKKPFLMGNPIHITSEETYIIRNTRYTYKETSPLWFAVAKGNIEMAKLLLEAGARNYISRFTSKKNSFISNGEPMHLAVALCNYAMFDLLYNKNKNIHVGFPYNVIDPDISGLRDYAINTANEVANNAEAYGNLKKIICAISCTGNFLDFKYLHGLSNIANKTLRKDLARTITISVFIKSIDTGFLNYSIVKLPSFIKFCKGEITTTDLPIIFSSCLKEHKQRNHKNISGILTEFQNLFSLLSGDDDSKKITNIKNKDILGSIKNIVNVRLTTGMDNSNWTSFFSFSRKTSRQYAKTMLDGLMQKINKIDHNGYEGVFKIAGLVASALESARDNKVNAQNSDIREAYKQLEPLLEKILQDVFKVAIHNPNTFDDAYKNTLKLCGETLANNIAIQPQEISIKNSEAYPHP